MSVLVIQGPHRGPLSRTTPSLNLLEGLAQRVRNAGALMEVVSCSSATGLVKCLKRARAQDVDVVLVDSGELDSLDCARHEQEIREALDALNAPYIEVLDRSGCDLESRVRPSHFALAIVVMTRDLARSYTVAIGITLRRLARTSRQTRLPSPSPIEA